jgi:hypothetical protein
MPIYEDVSRTPGVVSSIIRYADLLILEEDTLHRSEKHGCANRSASQLVSQCAGKVRQERS